MLLAQCLLLTEVHRPGQKKGHELALKKKEVNNLISTRSMKRAVMMMTTTTKAPNWQGRSSWHLPQKGYLPPQRKPRRTSRNPLRQRRVAQSKRRKRRSVNWISKLKVSLRTHVGYC